MKPVVAFFHPDQLRFKPVYEWAFGERIDHPETTARAENIVAALDADALFSLQEPEPVTPLQLQSVHALPLLTLYHTAALMPEGEAFYPTVFPKLSQGRGDPTQLTHAGHFCFDAGTPLNRETASAAGWSAACALSAAEALTLGQADLVYALSRPPGHHATEDLFGGYCYYNNAALAAKSLRSRGLRVAIVDIDFHHGNGTQSIFYDDDQVLVVNLHGDPADCFPYFAGFATEVGRGAGQGFTMNLPLPRGTDGQEYLRVLRRHVLPALTHFAPDALVVSAGLDAYHLDPVGDFTLRTEDFHRVGAALGSLGLPTIAVQEGGYYTPDLGANATALLRGLREGLGR
ncbi:MAG: histone deacetylase family protein [Deltaproteobacteria bacterium]|nr:MAG: histone deacetylase family protein [Deltaproteobacteria bacterium]